MPEANEQNELDDIVAQPTESSQADIEPEGSTVGEAPAPDTAPKEEKEAEVVDESPGIVNLRNHVKELESDINTVYKPSHELIEKFGGMDLVSEGLGLLGALQEPDETSAAEKFLDNLYLLSNSKYQSIVQKVFQDHGEMYVSSLNAGKSVPAEKGFEWEGELDPDDPVKMALNELRQELAQLKQEKTVTVQTQTNEEIQAAAQAREASFLDARYAPLKASLEALDLGEDTDFYRSAISATVERMFTSNSELMKKFEDARTLAIKGEEKFAVAKISEIDKSIRELTQKAIDKVLGSKVASVGEVKTKIEENSKTLAKADQVAAAAAARTTPDGSEDTNKAFDPNSQQARLKQMIAEGRFGKI